MEKLRVPVYYDFASTLCYVGHRVMERMAGELEELGVELGWTPIDLVRITGWERGAVVEGPRRENALRVCRELRVEARMPARWLDSRAAGAAALALGEGPREASFRERVFSGVYEEGGDVGDPACLGRWAADLGLDLASLATPRSRGALEDTTRAAHAAEVTGVPTFMLGPWPFGGIQEEATMRSILTRWARKCRASSAAPS